MITAPARARPTTTTAQRWTLALAGIGSFVVILDLFAVATALPALRDALHASLGTLDWTVNAYTLTFAVLMMTAATLGDRWGRGRLYAAGLLLFSVASAACALAGSAGALIAARAVQGVGAAILMPMALALLNAAFPADRRGWAMGVFGSVTGLATVLGPILGGVITQALDWSWIFWINVPIGILAAVATLTRVQDSRGTHRALDPVGLVLGGVTALALVWGVVRAADAGWGDGRVLGSLLVGVVALVALVRYERRPAQPMVPLRLFADRGFAAACAAMFLLTAGLTAVVFFTAQYLQEGQGAGPLGAGLRLLPIGVMPLVLATRSGAAADRLGTRPMIVGGLVLQVAGTVLLAMFTRPYPVFAAGLLLLSLGITFAVPALTKAVVGSVEPADISTASGVFSTLRQLGGAFGVAVTSAAFASAGGYADVTSGFRVAMVVAVVLAGLALAVGLAALPRR
ncbi:MAG TPA: DHA2 family efflux MFS transporter permease subunit [Pseudonocardiaceae bacterium]|jgi:EmrB/QacA subfamily drug resistance transporter|nr:DHA2 family efflux MFS transporter permease subunit [Pseudonocardiaceae bacterium]